MLCNEEMRKSILSRLQGYRYEHSLGVERAAIMLAEKYGEDPEKAGTAGILHDITKYLSPQEQLNLCGKYGIIPCTVEKSEPKMLHGKTAAAIARAEYHMPEDICDAIACHTTGKNHMTLLDKILYLADYIEETRDFPGVDKARELALEACDVLLGNLCRMNMVLDGKVLSRQTECVPAHRIQHVVALHALFARNDIQRGVRARMAYMQTLTGRIRELYERVELLLVRVILGMEALLLVPDVLPFLFYLFMIVLQRILPLK